MRLVNQQRQLDYRFCSSDCPVYLLSSMDDWITIYFSHTNSSLGILKLREKEKESERGRGRKTGPCGLANLSRLYSCLHM